MSAVNGTLDELQAGLQLCRLALIVFKAQRRITADLPQSCQLRKDQKLVLIELRLILLCQCFLHMKHLAVIELLLCTSEPDVTVLLQLLRQVFQNVPLQPPQDKGTRHFLQPGHGGLVAALHDRAFHLPLKYIVAI